MPTVKNRRNQLYGTTQGLTGLQQEPIIQRRVPTTADNAELGTVWVDTLSNSFWILTNSTAGVNTWTATTGGATTLASLAVTPGNITVDTGNITVDIGSISATLGAISAPILAAGDIISNSGTATTTIGGTTLDINTTTTTITGAVVLNGDFDLTDAGSILLRSTNNAADAILLHANSGATETIHIRSQTGTAVNSLNFQSDVGGMTFNAGLGTADAFNITCTDAAGGIDIDYGTGGMTIDGANGAFALVTGTGAIDLGVDAAQHTITAGNSTGATSIVLNTGTGALNLGTNAIAHAVNIGNVTGATAVSINGGTGAAGAINIGTGAHDTPITIGNVTGATAVVVNSGTSGLQVNTTGVGDVDINASNAITLDSAAASNFTVTGAADLTISSTLGSVIINAEEAVADALQLQSVAGGLDVNVALQMNLDSSQAAADAARIIASDAAGGIDMDCGTGGATLDSTGAISIDAADASNFTVSDVGQDLTLASTLGRVVVNAEEAAADALTFLSAAGGLDANVALQMNLDSSQAAADAVRIIASDAAGGLDIDCGTAGATLDSTGGISIDSADASNFTITGAADLTLSSTLGSIILNAEEAAADAFQIQSAAGGLDLNVALQMNLDSSQAAANAVRIVASDAASGIDIDCGTAGATLDSTGGISIDAAAASNFTVTGATEDLTLSSAGGSLNLSATEAAADAVTINATAGGVTVDAAGAFSIDGALTSNVTVTGAGVDLNLQSVGGSILMASNEAVPTALTFQASNAAGGIVFDTPGNVAVDPAVDTQASPIDASTLNFRVLRVIFTGYTTAAAADQAFVINSDQILETSGIFVHAANLDASGNHAAVAVMGTVQATGSITVTVHNYGGGALGAGDNVIITVWIVS